MAAYTLRTDTLETSNMVDTSRVELARNTLTLINLCRKWTQGNEKKSELRSCCRNLFHSGRHLCWNGRLIAGASFVTDSVVKKNEPSNSFEMQNDQGQSVHFVSVFFVKGAQLVAALG